MERMKRLYDTFDKTMTREKIQKLIVTNIERHMFSMELLNEPLYFDLTYKDVMRIRGFWMHEAIMSALAGAIIADMTTFFIMRTPAETDEEMLLSGKLDEMMKARTTDAVDNGLFYELATKFGTPECDVAACEAFMDQLHTKSEAMKQQMLAVVDSHR